MFLNRFHLPTHFIWLQTHLRLQNSWSIASIFLILYECTFIPFCNTKSEVSISERRPMMMTWGRILCDMIPWMVLTHFLTYLSFSFHLRLVYSNFYNIHDSVTIFSDASILTSKHIYYFLTSHLSPNRIFIRRTIFVSDIFILLLQVPRGQSILIFNGLSRCGRRRRSIWRLINRSYRQQPNPCRTSFSFPSQLSSSPDRLLTSVQHSLGYSTEEFAKLLEINWGQLVFQLGGYDESSHC